MIGGKLQEHRVLTSLTIVRHPVLLGSLPDEI